MSIVSLLELMIYIIIREKVNTFPFDQRERDNPQTTKTKAKTFYKI